MMENQKSKNKFEANPQDPHGYLFDFVEKNENAVQHANREICKIVHNVQLTKEQARQEMFDKRNEANFQWQRLDNKGFEDRADADFRANETLKNIDEEATDYIAKEKAELAQFKSLQEESRKRITEEVDQKLKALRQKEERDITELKRKTESDQDRINVQMMNATRCASEAVERIVVTEEVIRNQRKIKNTQEINEMEADFQNKMKAEEEKQHQFRRQQMQVVNRNRFIYILTMIILMVIIFIVLKLIFIT